MKKTILILSLLTVGFYSNAQLKSTGVLNLGTQMTLKIDLEQASSLATFTITGPASKWFAVSLNATTMSSNTPADCIFFGTTLLDRHLSGGHNAPTTDATNNLTLASNTVTGTTRTIVVTRPFNTGDVKDFVLAYEMSALNIIWAVGQSTNSSQQHSVFGSKALSFTLGIEPIATLQSLVVYPNPSNGIFSLENSENQAIESIKIFDSNARLVKELTSDFTAQTIQINLSDVVKGIYFIEVSNQHDKTVKKISVQ